MVLKYGVQILLIGCTATEQKIGSVFFFVTIFPSMINDLTHLPP